jgi:hypothetical protein
MLTRRKVYAKARVLECGQRCLDVVPSKRSSADGSWVAWVRAVFMQQCHLILMSVVWWLLGTHELYYGLYSCTSILVVKGALMLSSQMYVEYKWILELNPPDHQPILVGAIFKVPREHPTSLAATCCWLVWPYTFWISQYSCSMFFQYVDDIWLLYVLCKHQIHLMILWFEKKMGSKWSKHK